MQERGMLEKQAWQPPSRAPCLALSKAASYPSALPSPAKWRVLRPQAAKPLTPEYTKADHGHRIQGNDDHTQLVVDLKEVRHQECKQEQRHHHDAHRQEGTAAGATARLATARHGLWVAPPQEPQAERGHAQECKWKEPQQP
mmetsp:Transcript_60392/g.194471  ORF Transcript_60392/g.194471 Transcript_60392/m.194471 type:complete len:142 (-) Transcript_60392:294-719(-)